MKKIIAKNKGNKGYAILFTVIIVSAISVITAGLTNVAYKQLILSSLAKDSQSAFYEADTAGDCALYADRIESLKTPPNIFTTGTFNCGGSNMVVSTPTGNGDYTIYPVSGDSNSLNPCFRIDVTKTNTSGSPSWQTNLLSWWKFEGDASDSVGSNDGTIYGATGTSARCATSNCYDFNGSSDYIDIGNPASLGLTGAMTASAWVYIDSVDNRRIVSKLNASNGWSLNIESSDAFAFMVSSSSSDIVWIESNAAPSDYIGELVHVVGVYEPSVGLRIYVNGVLDNELTTGVPASQYNNSSNVNIGRRSNATVNSYWDGTIDEVMIWNRALSTPEIQELNGYFTGASTPTIQTTISAKGYNICNVNNLRTVEREIEINYEE
ncbi:MAG TPA: LamG domain-containing protein [Candidatus Paceibacterota bacterium]|nr:LamG domain-containing protein [Candidatus Paceibacterota bacterium]